MKKISKLITILLTFALANVGLVLANPLAGTPGGG